MFFSKVNINLCIHVLMSLFVGAGNSIVRANPLFFYSNTSYHLPSGSAKPFSIARSPDNALIATENTGTNTVTIFKAQTDGSMQSVSYALKDSMHNGFTSVAFSPSGAYLAVADGYANGVTMFRVDKDGNLITPGTFYTVGTSINPGTATFSPNGLFLVTANDSDISVFSVEAGGTLTLLGSAKTLSPKSMAFSPDGSYFATANFQVNSVTVFGPNGGTKSISYALPVGSTTPYCVAYSPDGSYLATANYGSNDVTIFNVGVDSTLSNKMSFPLPSGSKAPVWLAFSSDGSYLATANYGSNDITLFSVTTNGALVEPVSYPLPTGSFLPASIVFASDDSYIATANNGSDDITIFKLGIDNSISDDSGSSGSNNLGLILGLSIGIGAPVVVAALGITGYCLYKKSKRAGYTSVDWGTTEL